MPGRLRSVWSSGQVSAHPAHALYDSGCELLAAAQALAAASCRQDCGQAIPATLGCLGATLDQLAGTSGALAQETRRTRTLSDRHGTATMQALDRLTEALTAAAQACETARAEAAAAGAPVTARGQLGARLASTQSRSSA